MRITAAVVEARGAPFALQELELGEPRDDEVLVELAASGICHTDLVCRDGDIPTPRPAHFFAQSSFATHCIANERNVVKLDSSMPLELAAPLGCGIQTGAGAVLNVLRPPAGSSIAIFGAGGVGLAAAMAATIAGSTTIVAVDIRESRLELARELGATRAVDASEGDAAAAVREAPAAGSRSRSRRPACRPQCAPRRQPRADGRVRITGAPPFGSEVALDVQTVMTGGRPLRGIVEGEAVPQEFLPRLVAYWREGRFPVERLMRFYDFDQIDRAARDAESGEAIKPVLRMGA